MVYFSIEKPMSFKDTGMKANGTIKLIFFSQKLIFSDEPYFKSGRYVNKQNSRIWGEENPGIIHEKPFHPQRIIVWCTL